VLRLEITKMVNSRFKKYCAMCYNFRHTFVRCSHMQGSRTSPHQRVALAEALSSISRPRSGPLRRPDRSRFPAADPRPTSLAAVPGPGRPTSSRVPGPPGVHGRPLGPRTPVVPGPGRRDAAAPDIAASAACSARTWCCRRRQVRAKMAGNDVAVDEQRHHSLLIFAFQSRSFSKNRSAQWYKKYKKNLPLHVSRSPSLFCRIVTNFSVSG